jgi:hypothetical protein
LLSELLFIPSDRVLQPLDQGLLIAVCLLELGHLFFSLLALLLQLGNGEVVVDVFLFILLQLGSLFLQLVDS